MDNYILFVSISMEESIRMDRVKAMDNTTEENVWTDAFNIKNIYYAIHAMFTYV